MFIVGCEPSLSGKGCLLTRRSLCCLTAEASTGPNQVSPSPAEHFAGLVMETFPKMLLHNIPARKV